MIVFLNDDLFGNMLSTNVEDILSGPFLSTIIMMFLLLILVIAINISSKKALKNPLETPKGLFYVWVLFVQRMENLVADIMGEKNRGFAAIIVAISIYLFTGFIFGLTGLPSPSGSLAFPLSLALVTFGMIHGTAMKHNKLRYFKRFIEPIPVFLPINLLSMWAPLLSLTLRLFGNATAGYCLMTVLYAALSELGGTPGFGYADFWVGVPITSLLHAYFDLFSGFIQTTVFIMLTMILVSQEQPDEEERVIEAVQKL